MPTTDHRDIFEWVKHEFDQIQDIFIGTTFKYTRYRRPDTPFPPAPYSSTLLPNVNGVDDYLEYIHYSAGVNKQEEFIDEN